MKLKRSFFIFSLLLSGNVIADINPISEALDKNANLQLNYKNYYWNENYIKNENYAGKDVLEWTQAIALTYQSGYINDYIGLDFGAVAVYDVGGVSKGLDENYRPAGNRAIDGSKQRANVTTAYLKAKYDFGNNLVVTGGYGKKQRHMYTYQGQFNRIAPNASTGIDLGINGANHRAYFTYVDGIQKTNGIEYIEELVNYQNDVIDYIGIIGIEGKFGNINYALETNKSDHFLARSFAKISYYSTTLDSDFELRYRIEKENGDKFEFKDHKSSFINFIYKKNIERAKLTLAYKQVFDGDLYNQNAENSYGSCTNSIMFEWELPGLEGEQIALIKFERPLDDLLWQGLKAEYTLMHGFDADHVIGYKRNENNFKITQDFGALDPILQGLSLQWYQVWVRADGIDDGYRNNKHSELYTLYSGDITRLNLNYTFKF